MSLSDLNELDQMRPVSAMDPYGDSSSGFGHWRWLVGSVVLVPVLLVAGVYWLHQLPVGPSGHTGDSTIHVELIPSPAAPATDLKQASLQANPPIADFQVMPAISEQAQPPVEEKAAPQPVVQPRPAASPVQQPVGAGQARPVPAGVASRFQRLLLAHIERFQRYPTSAGRDGLQGTVLVMFAMRRDGSVVRVDVKSSSGRTVLDREAIETIRRAQPLPQIPADMPDQLTVMLPVAFDAR